MVDIAEDKMNELPGAERYKKTSADMKKLTVIEKKIKKGDNLIKDDLIFLYEIDSKIEGFDYRDRRIAELRATRNTEEDMLVVLDCTKERIAHNNSEIAENTKAYLGQLEPGIFNTTQEHNIENVYTSFPEGKIRKFEATIGCKTSKQLKLELKKKKIEISGNTEDMLRSKKFTTLNHQEQITLVRLKVRDLGFKNGGTTDEIYTKAKEFGLELCPAEVGPNLRLKYMDQPSGEWLYIAMKQLSGSGGHPRVFKLERNGADLWLDDRWAGPGDGWGPDHGFVFALRKLDS